MKMIKSFLGGSLLTFGLLSAPTAMATGPSQSSQKDLVQTLVEAGNFTTLAAALEATNLAAALQGDQDLTVFAPTDAAFAKLGSDTIETLLADTETLSSILLYHVVPGKVGLINALFAQQAETLNGATVSFSLQNFRAFVNDSRIVKANVRASNGVIHVIDTVLLPPMADQPDEPLPSLPELVSQTEQFSTLLSLLQAAELVDVLAEEGPFTVFAPTNDAFAKLPAAAVEALLADKDALRNVLLYHVVAGAKVAAETAVTLDAATMANGQDVTIRFDGKELSINDAKVIATDVEASNGIVHIIDSVLLP